jgi:4-hydroxybenzoate polyprenyltransferase
MGDRQAPVVNVATPRWRSYLLLARVSNLPTVWTNVAAGAIGTRVDLDPSAFIRTILAMSLFYSGGMFLNDAFDADSDSRLRPSRPIPSGGVTRAEVIVAGVALLGAGEALLAPAASALLLGLLLAAVIVWYDSRHKRNPAAPVLMGACRALVYCIAAAAAGSLPPAVLAGAAVLGLYVAGLTVVARLSGSNARRLVPILIAAISLVDAGFVGLVSRSLLLAAVTATGFAATLFLQRYVPGD